MAEHKTTNDMTPGVGLRPEFWKHDPMHRARSQRSIGGILLVVAITGFVLCMVATTFGMAPLALPVLILLVPVALLGRWLRERGALQLRTLKTAAARRGDSLSAI